MNELKSEKKVQAPVLASTLMVVESIPSNPLL